MADHLEHYRNPGGWVDFWIGLVVLIFSALFFGHIWYMENKVRELDAKAKSEIRVKAQTKR